MDLNHSTNVPNLGKEMFILAGDGALHAAAKLIAGLKSCERRSLKPFSERHVFPAINRGLLVPMPLSARTEQRQCVQIESWPGMA